MWVMSDRRDGHLRSRATVVLVAIAAALARCAQPDGAGIVSDPARSFGAADPLTRYQSQYPQRYPCAGAVPKCWGAPQL